MFGSFFGESDDKLNCVSMMKCSVFESDEKFTFVTESDEMLKCCEKYESFNY